MSLSSRPPMIGSLVGRLCAETTRFALTMPNDFESGTKVSLAKTEVWSTLNSDGPV